MLVRWTPCLCLQKSTASTRALPPGTHAGSGIRRGRTQPRRKQILEDLWRDEASRTTGQGKQLKGRKSIRKEAKEETDALEGWENTGAGGGKANEEGESTSPARGWREQNKLQNWDDSMWGRSRDKRKEKNPPLKKTRPVRAMPLTNHRAARAPSYNKWDQATWVNGEKCEK